MTFDRSTANFSNDPSTPTTADFHSDYESANTHESHSFLEEQVNPFTDISSLPQSVDNSEEKVDNEKLSLIEIKEKLSRSQPGSLVSLEQVRPPAGLATGIDAFDNFLLWKGIPKGDLSLFSGRPGTGATSLWIQAAQKVHEQKKWVAWVNSDWELLPSSLVQRKVDLKRLLVVRKPKEAAQMFWILQELISSSLFELIGCHIPEGNLKNHQLQKLKKLARLHKVALVIISHSKQWSLNPIFSLVIDCQRDFFTIKRALHRPAPFTVSGSPIHNELLSEMHFSPNMLLS